MNLFGSYVPSKPSNNTFGTFWKSVNGESNPMPFMSIAMAIIPPDFESTSKKASIPSN